MSETLPVFRERLQTVWSQIENLRKCGEFGQHCETPPLTLMLKLKVTVELTGLICTDNRTKSSQQPALMKPGELFLRTT